MGESRRPAARQDDMLEAVAVSAPVAIAIFDTNHTHRYVNTAFTRMIRRDAASITGQPIAAVFPDAAPIADALRTAASGTPSDFHVTLPSEPGSDHEHWIGIAFELRPAQRAGGSSVAVMMREITSRTRAEQELKSVLDRAQQSREEAERERDFLGLVVQNAPMAISVVEGTDHRLRLISDFALRILRTTRESVIGRPLGELYPDLFALVRDTYDRVYSTGVTVTVPERLYQLPDGRQVWTYSFYAPVIGTHGAPSGVMALSLDISELKRTQHIVESQKQVLEMMAEGRSLPGVLEAITNIITEHSAGAAIPSILLVTEDGLHLEHGAAPQLSPAYTAAIDGLAIGPAAGSCGTAAFRRERVVVKDVRVDPLWAAYRGLAETHGLLACWSTPILGADGNLLGTFAIYYREPQEPLAEDVAVVDLLVPTAALAIERHRTDAERQRLLDAERRARRDAEQANRSKDEFVAALSHELRTPLNAILGWTRILRAGELTALDQARALESIERNTRAQSQLVEDLLDMSRIVTGKLRLDVRSVELSGVVDTAVDAVRPAADAKEIRLQKILDPRAAPISGDPDRLQQVVWNLLSNAIKFTPKGGRVQVRLERVNSHVEIIVSDTGPGISAGLLPRIFDRFQQGNEDGTRSAGLGLGLAISRHLVELHGGTIAATSEGPGTGATFIVKLPVMAARGDRSPSDVHPTAPSGTVTPAVPELPAGIRILVVEDDPDGREIVASILERAGADVRTATSAAEGDVAIAEWRPDVLISDIEMPGEDGYTFIARLRQQPGSSAKELPAIALTAYARVEDRIKALAAGFQMHVPKPVEPAELVAVIRSLAPTRVSGV